MAAIARNARRGVRCRQSAGHVRVCASLRLFSSTSSFAPNGKSQLNPLNPRVTSSVVNINAVSVPTAQLAERLAKSKNGVVFQGVHHVALLCQNLEKSLEFYQGLLGLDINPDRPHHKLPYRGAWLWIGAEMIHLMELPNPDPLDARPDHGGRDRHFCVAVESIDPLVEKLESAGIKYTKSMSGRPALFFRDPDMNCLECVETEPWR